jgi:hypothetical protein
MSYRIHDINGKMVAQGNVPKNSIDVSNLQNGAYVLSITVDGVTAEHTIIKE